MALVTRCPNCTSVFKVTPQHLQAQEGNVRCGSCLQIFNSFSDLATLQENADIDNSLELSIENKEVKIDTQNEVLAKEASGVTKAGGQDSYTFDAIKPLGSRAYGGLSIYAFWLPLSGRSFIYIVQSFLFLYLQLGRT